MDILIVIGLIVAGVILFVTERVPVEIVALLIMTTLLAARIVTLDEGLSGLSNPATVAVAAMFILSTGLFKTGALNVVGELFATMKSFGTIILTLVMMVTIGFISAFINNTAALAIFLPIVLKFSSDVKVSPSRLLMPLSFASIFGGTCTLIGTSTNLLVNSIAIEHGMKPFGMFEFSKLGLIMAATGVAYMALIGIRMIPERRAAHELTEAFGLGEYLVEVVLRPDSRSVGRALRDSTLVRDLGLTIIEIIRDGRRIAVPTAGTVLEAGDILRIRCGVEGIQRLRERRVELRPEVRFSDSDLASDQAELVEAVIAPNSMMVGRSVRDIGFRNLFGANVLALRHRGRLVHTDIADERLSGGDVLLLEVLKGHISQLRGRRDFVLVSEIGLPVFRREKIFPAIAIVAGVVGIAATGVAPIAVTAVAGCVFMILTGCLSLEEAYRAVEWKVVFLLAGILPLGVALEKTGVASMMSSHLVDWVGRYGGSVAVLAALYLITSVLTEAMSNNATAVLLAPVAFGAAEAMSVDPRPFLIAVTFAASASFMTPIGYQTNTMVYGAGGYRFSDFLRVGIPLNVIFWVVSVLFIPLFWPF